MGNAHSLKLCSLLDRQPVQLAQQGSGVSSSGQPEDQPGCVIQYHLQFFSEFLGEPDIKRVAVVQSRDNS